MSTASSQARGRLCISQLELPALYRATITHLRRAPMTHRFSHRTFLWLVDVGSPPELPWLLRPLARFDRRDHLDIRALLDDSGVNADRIVMLAALRTFGHVFNPLSIYWCYSRSGELVCKVAEVHNTYGQRHAYLLPPDGSPRVNKELAVSPFHPAKGTYQMRISDPGQRLVVSVGFRPEDGEPFTSTMVAKRLKASLLTLIGLIFLYPWPTLRVSLLIRWEALRLFAKRAPRYRR
ncbi:MAG: DUF1365 domain-containing protein [Acidimicrobiales bacterium]